MKHIILFAVSAISVLLSACKTSSSTHSELDTAKVSISVDCAGNSYDLDSIGRQIGAKIDSFSFVDSLSAQSCRINVINSYINAISYRKLHHNREDLSIAELNHFRDYHKQCLEYSRKTPFLNIYDHRIKVFYNGKRDSLYIVLQNVLQDSYEPVFYAIDSSKTRMYYFASINEDTTLLKGIYY